MDKPNMWAVIVALAVELLAMLTPVVDGSGLKNTLEREAHGYSAGGERPGRPPSGDDAGSA